MSTTDTQHAPDTLRGAELAVLAQALNDQRTRSVDVVAPAKKLTCSLGAICVDGVDPVVGEEGVTVVNGAYTPTRVGDEGLSQNLGIPLNYLRRMREHNIALYDANVDGWLHRDDRSFLLRLLTHRDGPNPDDTSGVLRAVLSTSYRCIDHFDVLLAALKGLTDAGVTDPIIDADLTERRMVVRVSTPDIAIHAPALLEGYRSPWGGQDVGGAWTPERVARVTQREHKEIEDGGDVVFAGFVISNSETGNGAFSLTPRLTVKVCTNGLLITADAERSVHLGARMEDGRVPWSDRTARKNLDLITSQTTDAVREFLTPDYVRQAVSTLEAIAGIPVVDADAVITAVAKKLSFSEADQKAILACYIRGGQMTCGGIMQAVTAAAQTLADGDAAWEMELRGVAAMREAVNATRALAKVGASA